MSRLFVLLLISGILFATWAPAREVVPAPPVGEGVNILAADHAVPFSGKTPPPGKEKYLSESPDIPTRLKEALGDRTTLDSIGGDDVPIELAENMVNCDIDIASNGDIFVAVAFSPPAGVKPIEVYRSRDRGQTWQDWGRLPTGPIDGDMGSPDILIAEGDVDRCFVAFWSVDDEGIVVAHSPLSSADGSWTEVVAMTGEGADYDVPKLATDASNYSNYFLYLVGEGNDGNGDDIWFARSIDQGDSFEAQYKIGSISFPDRDYRAPQICYGFGGRIHVVWFIDSYEGAVEPSVRYRTVPFYAEGGLDSWDTIKAITPVDGIDEKYPLIAASTSSSDVVISYRRGYREDDVNYVQPANVIHSTDDGANFGPHTEIPNGIISSTTLAHKPDDGTWLMSGSRPIGEAHLQRTPTSDPLTWSPKQIFGDIMYACWHPGGHPVAQDPSDGYRVATAWVNDNYCNPPGLYFDAEWRSDPGFPNLEPGFPLGLWAPPLSPPAVVDVDGDGDLEIVFSDELRQIQVINHDGSSALGWPQDVGVNLSDGPVAIGDLNGDGHPALVVGGTDGNAYAYDHQGNPLPGWPTAITPPGHDIYVSIGAVGGPYPRSVVCAGANYITLRSHHGVAPPGTIGWSIGGGGTFESPAVIGDIDDDGIAEIVGGLGHRIFAFKKGVNPLEFNVILPNAVSDALTLGDLDLDGDLEILCPTESGVLYALNHNGISLGGNFPFDTGSIGPLTSAAIAQFRGPLEPEIAFAHRDWTVHALFGDGSVVGGYPKNTTVNWYLYGAPVFGPVNLPPTDVVVGDRGDRAWAWSYTGNPIYGWPHDVQNKVNHSPAMGDVDLDGNNELVFLTETQIFVIDVNADPTAPILTWPMYGHDPQRTGCSDCAEDLVTPVDPGIEDGVITRVSFAGASPNPVSGGTQFSFAVPLRSAVSLDILDLRGARVYTVYREETEAGAQVVTWNGRDGAGRPLASGAYFARLKVKGPGLNEELTRKLMVVK